MRIAHVTGSLDPRCGGPPIVAVRLAAEQVRQKHRARVISCISATGQQRIDAMLASIPGADLVEYHAIPEPGHLEVALGTTARRSIREQLSDTDILHLHGVWDSILKLAVTVADELGIPYVIAPHGMLDPWSLGQKSLKKKLVLALGYRGMLNRASFLHLLNPDEEQRLGPLGLTASVEIVPNGIAPDEFAALPAGGEFRAMHPEIDDAPYILFLGRLHHKKGLDILAGAFATVAEKRGDARLVVAGHDEGARGEFENLIADAGLQGRVHLVGPVSGREKLAAFVDAACFCLPSRQEGFSIAILEAMACSRPVVISAECHFPEAAEQNAGMVVPLGATAFADAMLAILSDPQLGSRMGHAGRAMVIDRFTWARTAGRVIAAYERHLNGA
jgi:glycosyltransferase involved in cell wall biosynthesis